MPSNAPQGDPRSRRTFSEPPKRRALRDMDASERAIVMRAVTSGMYGGVLGGLLGFSLVAGGRPFWVLLLCVAAGWLAVSAATLVLVHAVGGAASTLYAPDGRSTPKKKEYSQAESLVARGLYQEAVTAFELAVLEDPTEPTPYLRVARIKRDHLAELEDAARWFRRALRESQAPPGVALLARKELVELYTHRMGAPERALPELARMAEELAGSAEGAWAAAEYAAIKARLAEDPGSTAPEARGVDG